ncbi:MAG: hypothetical protein AAF757_31410, partial [Cyanobacteria bacterium P01_D01_bin.116]
ARVMGLQKICITLIGYVDFLFHCNSYPEILCKKLPAYFCFLHQQLLVSCYASKLYIIRFDNDGSNNITFECRTFDF